MSRTDQSMQQLREAYTDPTNQPGVLPPSVRARRVPRIADRWYYLVLIATAGLFAWIPFLHAALRLKTAKSRRMALIFGALDAIMYVLLAVRPQDNQDHTSGGPLSTISGLLGLGVIIVGCIMLTPLHQMVYNRNDQPSNTDPAINVALTARARRADARKLAADDPLLAHELLVGRPDLARIYDDGGLVDLNSAPASVIAETCGIRTDVAAAIVETRNHQGPFSTVDELFVLADLPIATWDRIRDRAVLLP